METSFLAEWRVSARRLVTGSCVCRETARTGRRRLHGAFVYLSICLSGLELGRDLAKTTWRSVGGRRRASVACSERSNAARRAHTRPAAGTQAVDGGPSRSRLAHGTRGLAGRPAPGSRAHVGEGMLRSCGTGDAARQGVRVHAARGCTRAAAHRYGASQRGPPAGPARRGGARCRDAQPGLGAAGAERDVPRGGPRAAARAHARLRRAEPEGHPPRGRLHRSARAGGPPRIAWS